MLFLALDEVLALHAGQTRRYGGRRGIRDVELLQSVLAIPSATSDSTLLHPTLSEMAAAYLFHLVQNHAFIDGNERVGLVAALAFLGLNDVSIEADPDEFSELVLGVAAGRVSKAEVAVFLQDRARPRR
ncbi:MAG: type II toxin-antitoxin system death-on-curing family toxin [Deltaproteobacteria bacterium]|nr:type II toxin-antitoxin system death-on-curing family toxin [Deltaproteobacteria bacterium]